MAKSNKNYHYHEKFPPYWIQTLKDELAKEFVGYPDTPGYLPPVKEQSVVGAIAGNLPSKPQGITIGGTIYYTPRYPVVREQFREKYGDTGALIYECGMYVHETYHAIDQEEQGKSRWLIKYILRLIKTPNAKTHPMEIPAYQFQKYLKCLVRSKDSDE